MSSWASEGVFGQEVAEVGLEPYNQGEIVYMDCPFCRHAIAATWQPFAVTTDDLGRNLSWHSAPPTNLTTTVQRIQAGSTISSGVRVTAEWLKCQNNECQEIIVRINRVEGVKNESWIALPKRPNLPTVNALIPDQFKKDYLEAWTILDDSPRMSAVLSRRLLADLLEQYAGLNQFSLAKRIDEFVKDVRHPLWIRQNLHYLREVGDFGAHTQQDKAAAATQPPSDPVIIDVDKSEAEWTLKIIGDLFEYFIVAPQKDKDMRTAIDKKLADAKRNPITPLTG